MRIPILYDMVVYVGDASSSGGWGEVFVADTSQPESPRIYTAQHGEIRVDGVKRTVQMVLARGQTHFIDRRTPERYEATQFDRVVLTLDPAVIFKNQAVLKGEPEKTIAELRQDMDYVLKKLGFTREEFDEIMKRPPRRHDEYATDQGYMATLVRFGKFVLRK